MRSGEAKVGGKTVFITGVDESLTKVVDMTWKSGSNTVPEQLGTTARSCSTSTPTTTR